MLNSAILSRPTSHTKPQEGFDGFFPLFHQVPHVTTIAPHESPSITPPKTSNIPAIPHSPFSLFFFLFPSSLTTGTRRSHFKGPPCWSSWRVLFDLPSEHLPPRSPHHGRRCVPAGAVPPPPSATLMCLPACLALMSFNMTASQHNKSSFLLRTNHLASPPRTEHDPSPMS